MNEMLKAHPYEEAAYDIYPLTNNSMNFGFGAIGELDEPVRLKEFIARVKENNRTGFRKSFTPAGRGNQKSCSVCRIRCSILQ